MDSNKLTQFNGQQFLNLETYRANGQGVPTPVWFVEEDNVLFVRTGINSGKVKRIRNNPQVRIVPCKAQGEPMGEWISAQAQLVDEAQAERVSELMIKKYNLSENYFEQASRLPAVESATIALSIG